MSSISHIERSSSQTRMLATRSPFPNGAQGYGGQGSRRRHLVFAVLRFQLAPTTQSPAPQAQHERCALAQLRARPYLAFMRLHNLVNDGQAQPGATVKARLERLKDLFRLLSGHSDARIGEVDLPVVADRIERNGESAAAVFHRAHRVLAEVPEDLLDLVAVGQRESLLERVTPLDANAGMLRLHAVFEQS